MQRYRAIRQRSRYLTRGLAPEDQVVQSMADGSPTKWHLAHTTWFFETFILVPHLPGYRLHDERYPFLFNSYYVQAGERHCRARRGYLSRPTVEEVCAYREAVDGAMEAFLSEALDPEVHELVELGLNHEQQHQELILTDLKHVFSVNPLRPAYLELAARGPEDSPGIQAASTDRLRWIPFEEGVRRIGWAGDGFSYDNEGPPHRRFLEPFALGHRLVTNGEYLEFMEDGGYRRADLWMFEGWAAVERDEWREPFYWEERDGTWWIFTLSGMRPLDPEEPVCHVNWYEADAFARWTGARLPREEEWEVAARAVASSEGYAGNFVESGRFHPAPAGEGISADPRDEEVASIRQLFGDVWEWTGSPYTPYPGFRPAPGAVGEYNGKFMANQYVLRGGSCTTPQSHIRTTYRNFFHPDASWQFSGIRLARDLDPGARG
ncbi:MAG: ergothioneine biosynthesis protein EgtB [Longimicrobiales bacterium]